MAQEEMRPQHKQRRQLKRPPGIKLIASLTIFNGLYGIAILALPDLLGLSPINPIQEEYTIQATWEYTIQATWIAGIGITEIIIGIFTFKGKAWAWNSNVVSQLATLLYLTMLVLTISSLESYPLEQILIGVIIPIIIPILILPYLFTSKPRFYFGKGKFSLKHIMQIDKRIAKNYLHHLWIAAISATILFSVMGLLVLVVSGLQNREIMWIAALLFVSSAMIPGLAFEACKRKSRLSSILLLIVFVVTAGLAASSSAIYGHVGFWSFSTEILGIPLFQGVRCISVISRAASV